MSCNTREACGLKYSAHGLSRGKRLPIDDEDVRTGAREPERRGRARGSATDDDDVGVAHAGTRSGRQTRALARAARWKTPM